MGLQTVFDLGCGQECGNRINDEDDVATETKNTENLSDDVVPEKVHEEMYNAAKVSRKTLFHPGVLIHYKTPEIKKLYEDNGGVKTDGSVGFDLVTTEDISIGPGTFKLVSAGIVVKPLCGFRITVTPRSSTFKKFGVLLANSIGIIDPDYCGMDDELKMCLFAPLQITKWNQEIKINDRNGNRVETMEKIDMNLKNPILIPKGTSICQMILEPALYFTTKEFIPEDKSRGGIGSTDNKGK